MARIEWWDVTGGHHVERVSNKAVSKVSRSIRRTGGTISKVTHNHKVG